MVSWALKAKADLRGKFAIVTGANSGIGFETAVTLSQWGATVIIACRSQVRAEHAIQKIKTIHPESHLQFHQLDLSSLQSVRSFATIIRQELPKIDILINNAGVMTRTSRQITKDGFELHFAVNHLGHFVLTNELLPLILKTQNSRIVQVSSLTHWTGKIHWNDINLSKNYQPWKAYAQSKLANLLFMRALYAKCKQSSSTLSLAAHPGYTATNLLVQNNQTQLLYPRNLLYYVGNLTLAQSAANGALPQIYAATSQAPVNGGFYGPKYLFGLMGPPTLVKPSKVALHNQVVQRFWDLSMELAYSKNKSM